MSSVTITLHIGFVVAGMATTLLGPILPALTPRWGMSDVVAGSLFTAQFLSAMTATLVAPALAARIGARGALALGFSLLAAGTFTIGIAPHAIGVVATVVYGLGLGTRAAADEHRDRRDPARSRRQRAEPGERVVGHRRGDLADGRAIVRHGRERAVPTAALAIACAFMAIACRARGAGGAAHRARASIRRADRRG